MSRLYTSSDASGWPAGLFWTMPPSSDSFQFVSSATPGAPSRFGSRLADAWARVNANGQYDTPEAWTVSNVYTPFSPTANGALARIGDNVRAIGTALAFAVERSQQWNPRGYQLVVRQENGPGLYIDRETGEVFVYFADGRNTTSRVDWFGSGLGGANLGGGTPFASAPDAAPTPTPGTTTNPTPTQPIIAPNGGNMNNGSSSNQLIAQMLLQSQANAAWAGVIASTNLRVDAATDLATLKGPIMGWAGAIVAPLSQSGQSSTASIASGNNNAALLVLALGGSVVSNIASALQTLNAAIAEAAAIGDAATAYNAFVTSVNAALGATQNNTLLASIANGENAGDSNTLLGFMLSQQATAAFTAQNGGTTTTNLATVQAAVAAFSSAFTSWLQSQLTYGLILQMSSH